MKILIKIWVCLFFTSNSLVMMAVEPLEGAFGYKLGSVADLNRVVSVETNRFGTVMVYLKPEVSDPDFLEYNLEVVPSDKRIYGIQTQKKYQTKAEAETAMRAYLEKMEAKYGPGKPIPNSTAVSIGDEARFLLMQIIVGTRNVTFLVTYKDIGLSKIADKEVESAKQKSVSPNRIEGAFGFKFGAVFDPSTALEKRPVSAGGYIYVVKPSSPNELFSDYFLVITPKSHKIVGIWANRSYKDRLEALEKQAVLKPILEGKYGKAVGDGEQSNKFVIQHPDESVSVTVLGNSDKEAYILIKYHSDKLNKIFVQEMQEKAAGKVDKSGL